MGTLSDITSKASNIKRQSNGSLYGSSKGYNALGPPGEKEKHAKTRSPHFMTPTFASKQTSSPPSIRPTTPVSPKSVKLSRPFLRRVGLKRVAETPRSKKESPPKGKNNISFPDKLAASIYERPPPTPPSVKKPAKVSPQDKPLPTPPTPQVDTSSPVKPTLTLIDATERPLRRSPPGQQGDEDWPVLRPRRVASTSPLQDVMRETGSQLRRQVPNVTGERYPRLGDLTRGASGEHNLPLSIYSPTQKSVRKEVSAPNLQSNSPKTNTNGGDMADPFQDTISSSPLARNVSAASSNLSAGAAAIEKSTSQDFTEVRQTRTSSLRARLSAGEVVRNRNSKIAGFTDFTASPEGKSGIQPRDSLRMRRESRVASTTTNSALRPEASVESLNRAPAKIIAGSRRAPPRRPGSRGSLHEDTRPSTASTRPGSRDTGSVYSTDRPVSKYGKDGRRSSIPVPKTATTIMADPAGVMEPSLGNGSNALIHRIDSSIQDSQASKVHGGEPMQAVRVEINKLGQEKATITDVKGKAHGLDAIEESPRQAYTFRRLSTKSPEFGPTLTISPSARRYIMGTDDKENDTPTTQQRRRSGDSKPSSGGPQANGKISLATRKRLERPQSIHDPSSPRTSLLDPKIREKKVRSADVGAMAEASGGLKVVKPLSKNPSNASSVNRPFYDASEELKPDMQTSTKTREGRRSIAQDDGWISPLKKSFDNGGIVKEKAAAVTDFAYTLEDKHLSSTSVENDEYDPFKYDKQPSSHDKKAEAPHIPAPQPPASTEPLKALDHEQLESISPSTFPRRNSTHLSKPGEVSIHKSLSINDTTKETSPPTPPKDFIHRQNNLGFARGHASSQLDLTKQFNNVNNANNVSKRNSTAGSSFRSTSTLQPSTSKSRFNIRTLFHKSSTETVKPKKSARGNKNKPVVQINGSPFPSISEVHPVHRPTPRVSPRNSANLTPTMHTFTNGKPPPTRQLSLHRPSTPIPASQTDARSSTPASTDLSHTTTLAMTLLDEARREPYSPKKERLLELGKIMVDVITQARDAERAVEESRMALRKAEQCQLGCERAVREVGRLVLEGRGDRYWA